MARTVTSRGVAAWNSRGRPVFLISLAGLMEMTDPQIQSFQNFGSELVTTHVLVSLAGLMEITDRQILSFLNFGSKLVTTLTDLDHGQETR